MSQEEFDCCRLCSSQKNLISMFSGKSRTIRDFLRKMIEETVDVKIEQFDTIPSVCFNCSVDVSNFYFFKLNCLQNEKDLKDTQSPTPKAKRFKLQSLNLKDVCQPDIEGTETVLKWLSSKRASLMHSSETLVDKNTQTIQVCCDIATQYDIETFVKQVQTSNPQLVDSETQCDQTKPQSPKKSVRSRSSQSSSTSKDIGTQSDMVETFVTESHTTNSLHVNSESHCDQTKRQSPVRRSGRSRSHTGNTQLLDSEIQCNQKNPEVPFKRSVRSRSSQTMDTSINTKHLECPELPKNKTRNRHCQTKTTCYEKSLQTSANGQDEWCQTDNAIVTDNFSQTEGKKLTQSLFQNSVVYKVVTKESSAQTGVINLVDKCTQCDILMINGFKKSLWQTKANIDSGECTDKYKIADQQTFTDALLNGFDNIFVSKMTQTELNTSQYDQCNLSNSFFSDKALQIFSTGVDSKKVDVDTKLCVKVTFPENLKQEEISPVESLSATSVNSPESNSLLSPRSADLLQVDTNKADRVKICKLCDKTLYNRREVVMHNKTHMQCNICRRKFRSLKATQNHITDCKVKLISISPFVRLEKIDQTPGIKEKYPETFTF